MISESYIMSLVKNYAKSPEGKKAIKETYGIDYDEKFTKTKIKMYANRMKKILFNHIHPLIKSIELNDIVIGEPEYNDDGYCEVHISFAEGSLHRDSLNPTGYPNGLQNIILLFKKGYHASNQVHGNWTYKGKTVAEGIWSRESREPNDFLDQAVTEFNNLANDMAIAVLEGEYA